ncbi:MAG: phospholipid carrier-dependent glycosyltransferase [Dehalococcoidales bacterium]
MEIKSKLYRFYKWEYFWLSLIVLATLIMHFCIITNPSDLIFDEKHYVYDARSISENATDLRPEHPPLGKLIIVAGIQIFGDNPWGWRVFPVLFGTATIIMFYLLCRRLGMSKNASNIATFLLAFENMTFVQNSVAMLDVFYLTFMMAAFLLYVSRRYITSGIAIGLAGLAKLNGLLALPTVVIHWFFTRQRRTRWFVLTIVFAVLAFVELMIVGDVAITRNFSTIEDPIHRLHDMMSLTSSLTFANVTHPAASPPWQWLLSYFPMAYWYMPHYSGALSFTIWAFTIPTFGYMVWRAIKKSEAALFGVAWFFSVYLIWIPATIITDRVTYPFYYYPAIGATCLGLGMALNQALDYFRNGRVTWLRRTLLVLFIVFLVAHLLSFLILSPLIPVDFAKLVGITVH